MLQRTFKEHMSFPSITYSSANRSPLASRDAAPIKSVRAITAVTIYAAIEFLGVAVSAYFIGFFYRGIFLDSWQTDPKYILAAIFIAILVLLISLGFRSYVAITRQPRHTFLWRGAGAVALAFSIFISIIFIAKLSDEYSRVTFILQTFGVGIIIIGTRALFYSWLQTAIASDRIEARRTVLIGTASNCSTFAGRLNNSGIRVISFFDLPKCHDMKDTCNPNTCELLCEIRLRRPDDVVVLTTNRTTPLMFTLTSCLAELPAGIHFVPIDALRSLATAQIIEFGNLRTIQIYRPPLATSDLFIKRTFDLIFATVGLILLAPLYLIVSIAIKLDSPGPVFFHQTRHGFNNEDIRVLKFRSMTTMEDGDQFTEAVKNDQRVTRIGRIIRSTNIDELPQLINVLRGEMSLVGPRPHATSQNAFFNKMIGRYSRRHNVKPGITGWAQINGYRGATDTLEKMERRIEYDLYYVDNSSFLFDVKIIMMTLFSKRAYINAY